MAKDSKMARRRETATEHLDIEGRTPRGFEALARYSRRLVHRFKSIELPAPKVELEVDPTTLANDLEPSTTRLVALVSRLRDGGWSEQDAIHARRLGWGVTGDPPAMAGKHPQVAAGTALSDPHCPLKPSGTTLEREPSTTTRCNWQIPTCGTDSCRRPGGALK